ncbi:MAG: hypothetical protein M3392_01710 [Actinomycetota bacterium]|nr:hypothetical protein [Actinomycetota bacterium]
MNEQQIKDYQRLPQSKACRLIDFEEVDVVTLEIFPPQHVLIVSGTKPYLTYLNMEVSLRPRTYIQQPEYWGIEVVGCLPGFGLPALAPYTVSIRLAGFMGTKGIEVIGATRSEKIELGDLPPEIYENWARSHEEDTERVEVYRPRDFAFPPSFPRPGFEIEENGEFQEYVPAPTDAGVVPGRAGCWKAVGGNIIRVRFDDPEAEPYTLRIASVEEGVLRIRR